MKFANYSFWTAAAVRSVAAFSVLLGLGGAAPSAFANVFASNLRLNNTSTNVVTTPGDSVTISYLLNQHADAGVTVAVVFGTNTLWSTNLTSSGTNRGVNSVVWNGKDANGNTASNGIWSVKVTAASAGRTNWWKVPMQDNGLTAHSGDGYVWSPFGIAVNNNLTSPYFGRIFVGNGVDTGSTNEAGDLKGIAKYNANGSYAGEGGHSTGGWNWNPSNDDNAQSPSKIEVGADDRVYVVDGIYRATVLSFDQLISTSAPPVLALDNNLLFDAGSSTFSGLSVQGTGTNRELFMTDIYNNSPGGLGIRRWTLGGSGVAATNDPGVTIVEAAGGSDLDNFPQDVAFGQSNRIYTIQFLADSVPSPRLLSFPPYQGSPLTTASWTEVASNENKGIVDAFGIAAALHTNYIAVVCRSDYNKPILIYSVTDTNAILLTKDGDGLNSEIDGDHDYTDVAWDRAGNLYVTDWSYSAWRVFSPPGANQFTTISLQTLKVGPYLSPTLLAPQWKTNQFQFQLSGETGVNYAIETSTNLVSWSGVATNVAPAAASLWTVPSPVSKAFFRARVVP